MDATFPKCTIYANRFIFFLFNLNVIKQWSPLSNVRLQKIPKMAKQSTPVVRITRWSAMSVDTVTRCLAKALGAAVPIENGAANCRCARKSIADTRAFFTMDGWKTSKPAQDWGRA